MDPDIQRNILKFGYGINYKYEGQLSHAINRFCVITKFQSLKFINTPTRFRGMPVDYNKNCDSYPHAIIQNVAVFGEIYRTAKCSTYILR